MCVEMHWILNFIKTYNMKILQVAFLLLFNDLIRSCKNLTTQF